MSPSRRRYLAAQLPQPRTETEEAELARLLEDNRRIDRLPDCMQTLDAHDAYMDNYYRILELRQKQQKQK